MLIWRCIGITETFEHNLNLYETSSDQRACVFNVLRPTRKHFGDHQVVHLSAPSCDSVGCRCIDCNQAFTPTGRKSTCRHTHTIRVDAEGLVEPRKFTYCPRDLLGQPPSWIVAEQNNVAFS